MSAAANDNVKQVTIYTDGAAEPNPGPGGYGVVLKYGTHRKELAGAFELTTNNRMELMAAIVGLEALKQKCTVTVYSDSQYLVESVRSGAVFAWRDNSWWRHTNRPTKNADLWQRLLDVYEKHDVSLVWVKGHSGVAENERCDQLALQAARGANRAVDAGYLAALAEASRGPESIEEGHPCGRCQTPLVKRVSDRKHKPGQTYYFAWHLYCPGCGTVFMVDEAKRFLVGDSETALDLFLDEHAVEGDWPRA
jgi:ribonuclease HI